LQPVSIVSGGKLAQAASVYALSDPAECGRTSDRVPSKDEGDAAPNEGSKQ